MCRPVAKTTVRSRTFFAAALAPAVLACLVIAVPARADKGYYGKAKIEPRPPMAAYPFDLKQVRLLPGPFKTAMDVNTKLLFEYDVEPGLGPFRRNAGLPHKGTWAGWDKGKLGGHFLGHYLSACSMGYALTGDSEFKKRVDQIVTGLAECRDALGSDGFLAPWSRDEVRKRIAGEKSPIPVIWYTLHKGMAGLLDAYLHCDNQQALELVRGMGDWTYAQFQGVPEQTVQHMLYEEYGGMNEVWANLYALTGEPKYLKLARKWDHKFWFDPFSKNQLPTKFYGTHANTLIPKIAGAARQYEVTGEDYYGRIARFFWKQVTEHHIFPTGATSERERFWAPDTFLETQPVSTGESCCAYNMLKLTHLRFGWDANPAVADYHERTVLNTILGSIDCNDLNSGGTQYHQGLQPGYWKRFQPRLQMNSCCSGTGIENHYRYGTSIYFHKDATLLVNLFIASTLDWSEKGVSIRQETRFPDQQKTALVLTARKPVHLDIRIRVPYWATAGVTLTVNGRKQDVAAKPSSYASLKRLWKDGDRIEMEMPMRLWIDRMVKDPTMGTVMCGPVVLAGEMGRDGLTDDSFIGTATSGIGMRFPRMPVFDASVVDVEHPERWIEPVDNRPLVFKTVNAGIPRDVTLSPFFRLNDQRHCVYWKFASAGQVAAYNEETARREAISDRTLDRVVPGDSVSEENHRLQHERSYPGGREEVSRCSREGGWFSYELSATDATGGYGENVYRDKPVSLRCTYRELGRRRKFRILVDGRELVHETLQDSPGKGTLEKEYPIPLNLTKGKEKITVKLISDDDGNTGSLFDCRTVKAK